MHAKSPSFRSGLLAARRAEDLTPAAGIGDATRSERAERASARQGAPGRGASLEVRRAIQSFLSGSESGRVFGQCVFCLVLQVLRRVAALSFKSLASSLILVPRSLALSPTLCSTSLIFSPALSTALPTLRGDFLGLVADLGGPLVDLLARLLDAVHRSRSRPSRAWFPRRRARSSGPAFSPARSIAAPAFSRPRGGLLGSRLRPGRYCSPRGPKPAKRPEGGSFSDEVAWKTSPWLNLPDTDGTKHKSTFSNHTMVRILANQSVANDIGSRRHLPCDGLFGIPTFR